MRLTLEHHGARYSCAVSESSSIAIELDFEGPQPNHFSAEKASVAALRLGGFTGDTKLGGSCNVDSLKMIPHCNGTHTETVSHIVNQDIWVGHAAMNVFSLAILVTVRPVSAKESNDNYRPTLNSADKIITGELLKAAIERIGDMKAIRPEAIIVRTIPNSADKCSRAYKSENSPAFFTIQAIEAINQLGVRHLLVDLPSVDRMDDDGLLTNHHIFWNVLENTHELSAETWQDKTITEMVYAGDEVTDGIYGLNLQIPAFCSDAAPSRPMIFPLRQLKPDSIND